MEKTGPPAVGSDEHCPVLPSGGVWTSHWFGPLTGLAVVLNGRGAGRRTLPAFERQLLVLQLHLGQVLLDVDGGLLGVAARRELLGPVVLIQGSWREKNCVQKKLLRSRSERPRK